MAPAVSRSSLAKPLLVCLLGAGSLWVGAQQAVFEGPLPTRMQFCQQEVQGAEGEERRKLLRECLLRRADAERLVLRDCRQRVREARVAPAERRRRQRDCEWRALAVHSSELPHPQPPVPMTAPQPAVLAGTPASDALPPAAPVVPEPARPVSAVEVQDRL